MELKIKDLTKQYANKKAINHITCTLTGITGLLGANGAGKSTLMRPILIEEILEASYPASTTLLVLSVMPTLLLQANRRIENRYLKRIIYAFTIVFSVFMVIGRSVSGVHWFTDIMGAVFLSTGLFQELLFPNGNPEGDIQV